MKLKNLKKILFGGLVALILARGMSCDKPIPNQPEESKVAVKLLSDNRASIHKKILSNLDLSNTLWHVGDDNEYLSEFDPSANSNDAAHYYGLKPASRCSLIHNSGDWYETQTPVAGTEFTVIQFDEDGKRKWANYGNLDWEGIVTNRHGTGKCLKISKDGYPALMYDNWIKLCTSSDATYLVLAEDILPIDIDQLKNEWKLVGDWNGWNYEAGLSAIEITPKKIKFDVSDIHGKVNVRAASKIGTTMWGRFGHLGTGELDGYKHPLIKYDESTDEAAINLP